MKRLTTKVLFAAALVVGLLSGCKEKYTTYSDAEYVMFADTMSSRMVLQDQEYFTVPIASTIACDYDRTFGVEVIDKGSNAIERLHYQLLSNSVTIKAGERLAEVRIKGNYDNIKKTDSLGFIMRLVVPDQIKWDHLYDNTRTKVIFMKGCPFSIDDFAGTEDKPAYAVISSMFLYKYPGAENTNTYQRLLRIIKHPTETNTVILKNWLFTGYDIRMIFDTTDPSQPLLSIPKDQILSDEELVFGQINGDNKIRVAHSNRQASFYNACQRYAQINIHTYVSNMGSTAGLPGGGLVGYFYNIMEWVSAEEAERLQREEGMILR